MKAVTENKIKVLKGNKMLKEYDIVDRTVITVDVSEKDESDQEIKTEAGEKLVLPDSEYVNLDETPNLRSCLVHQETNDPVENMTVDILKMTIKDLTLYIIKELHLNGPYRIRNLTTGKLYSQKDQDSLLSQFE